MKQLNFREEQKVVAVSGRDLQRSQEFADKHQISKFYSDYEALALDDQVQVVYIGITTHCHYEATKVFLNAGKSVLCEKPLGMNVEQTEEMIALAQSKKVFLMEAIWSRTFPVYQQLKRTLDQKTIGEVQHMVMTNGVSTKGPNLYVKEYGGGTVLEAAGDCIQLTLLAFGSEMPCKIQASTVKFNENGVDLGMSVTLHFPQYRMATFNTDLRVDLPNTAFMAGTGGSIQIGSQFWCPTQLCVSTRKLKRKEDFPLPSGAKFPFNFANSEGLMYEADHVRQCLQANLLESPLVPHQDSLLIARIQKEIMSQISSQ